MTFFLIKIKINLNLKFQNSIKIIYLQDCIEKLIKKKLKFFF